MFNVRHTDLSSHHLIHENSKRPPVDRRTVVFLQNDLRCDVVWRAAERTRQRAVANVFLAHAEISHLNMTVRIQQHIVQLQVTGADGGMYGMGQGNEERERRERERERERENLAWKVDLSFGKPDIRLVHGQGNRHILEGAAHKPKINPHTQTHFLLIFSYLQLLSRFRCLQIMYTCTFNSDPLHFTLIFPISLAGHTHSIWRMIVTSAILKVSSSLHRDLVVKFLRKGITRSWAYR